MTQFLGRATIRVNGQVIETNKGASLDLGGTKRNPIVTGLKVGYAEETVPAMIECETSLAAGMSLEDWRNLVDATAIFECDTGQSYVIRDAFVTEAITLKDGDGGNVALKIAGPGAEEVA
ncbi:Phage tail tube protein [Tistlia consotensis]|uniref:Phage tail tube protein n=1 Tax=Tistlia consotensis USBA 355 TaxID=560819 RepID=A0A1Y6CSD7_9PROT|nr:phage tail tube protein [Tistlia consotensis]SMF85924.1 Phage tail tube protein [Tistlia consotensis USBA 355]SNS41308.1 Phage tail tube protein [Tistlia consotensis]